MMTLLEVNMSVNMALMTHLAKERLLLMHTRDHAGWRIANDEDLVTVSNCPSSFVHFPFTGEGTLFCVPLFAVFFSLTKV